MKLAEILDRHSRRIRRNLEAMRLQRIRRNTRPDYTHCMNCGTRLKGMYCHRCGQYALDTRQPMWKYVRQYFENVYQFDGKIWVTFRLLFTRPGFLTNEFNDGKINSYVHPFRLYMCISVVFFTVFFMATERVTGHALLAMAGERIPATVMNGLRRPDATLLPDTTVYAYNMKTLRKVLDARGATRADSLVRLHYEDRGDELNRVTLPRLLFDSCLTRTALHEENQAEADSLRKKTDKADETDEDVLFYRRLPADPVTGRITAEVYDWMTRINRKALIRHQTMVSYVLGQLSKWTPIFLMLLLPLQALLFKLFYPRRHYMEHFAHATHLSSLLLVLITLPASVFLEGFYLEGESNLNNAFEAQDIVFLLVPLAMLFYQFVSMHTVYREGWGKTAAKCLLNYVLFGLLSSGLAAVPIILLMLNVLGMI